MINPMINPNSSNDIFRTQVVFDDNTVYWLNVPAGFLLPGDKVMIAERRDPLNDSTNSFSISIPISMNEPLLEVKTIGITLRKEYFEEDNSIKAKFGTLMQMFRSVPILVKGEDHGGIE